MTHQKYIMSNPQQKFAVVIFTKSLDDNKLNFCIAELVATELTAFKLKDKLKAKALQQGNDLTIVPVATHSFFPMLSNYQDYLNGEVLQAERDQIISDYLDELDQDHKNYEEKVARARNGENKQELPSEEEVQKALKEFEESKLMPLPEKESVVAPSEDDFVDSDDDNEQGEKTKDFYYPGKRDKDKFCAIAVATHRATNRSVVMLLQTFAEEKQATEYIETVAAKRITNMHLYVVPHYKPVCPEDASDPTIPSKFRDEKMNDFLRSRSQKNQSASDILSFSEFTQAMAARNQAAEQAQQ